MPEKWKKLRYLTETCDNNYILSCHRLAYRPFLQQHRKIWHNIFIRRKNYLMYYICRIYNRRQIIRNSMQTSLQKVLHSNSTRQPPKLHGLLRESGADLQAPHVGQRSDLSEDDENTFLIPGVNAKARSDCFLPGTDSF